MTSRLSRQLRSLEICILVPRRDSEGQTHEPLGYDYEAPAYRQEVNGWLDALGLASFWQPVTLSTLGGVLDRLVRRPCICLNLCDGNEAVDGYPGASVLHALESRGLPYTGAGPAFYECTTSKIAMKTAFGLHGVPTPAYRMVVDPDRDVAEACRAVELPLIVKPDVSGGSYGISLRSVVTDETSACVQVRRLLTGMHGFNFSQTGVFLERFIEGREFTGLLIPGPDGFEVLLAERVFNPALPPRQQLLSFERYWNVCQDEEPLPPGEFFYRYAAVGSPLAEELRDFCEQAFRAVGGDSYARVDLRMDGAGNIFVLEVNANCGLSSDPETSSVGHLCRIGELPFEDLLAHILEQALRRAICPARRVRSPQRRSGRSALLIPSRRLVRPPPS
jgi:D-alanine-D-alanine ligase